MIKQLIAFTSFSRRLRSSLCKKDGIGSADKFCFHGSHTVDGQCMAMRHLRMTVNVLDAE